jgi:NNMT/PNMT/TEMT family
MALLPSDALPLPHPAMGRWPRPPAYASFETDWTPRAYLADYYSAVEPDERRTIAFFVDAMKRCAAGEPMLVFGVGPTLHHVFLAAGTASELHLADYLPMNLREIERWIARDADAHDWRPFVRYTLACEGRASPTEADIAQREELTRARIARLLQADIRRADPLGAGGTPPYATVISAYCVDSATADRAAWRTYMRRLADLVRPGGTLILAALRRCRGYVVGGRTFPSADVDEHDLRAALELCCRPEDISLDVCELAGTDSKGYASIVLACGRRRRDAQRTPARVIDVAPARESSSLHDPILMGPRALGRVAPIARQARRPSADEHGVTTVTRFRLF